MVYYSLFQTCVLNQESALCFFFQAEDGIRDLVRSRGLGDVYKRQPESSRAVERHRAGIDINDHAHLDLATEHNVHHYFCLLYTSDAADERSSVDLGGRRIIKKKKIEERCSVVQTDR